MPKVKLLAYSWRRRMKDADGNVTSRLYRQGAEVDVTDAEYASLTRESFVRPQVEKVQTQTQTVQRTASASSDKK